MGLGAHFLFATQRPVRLVRETYERRLDKQSLIELLEAPVRALGYELVDLDVHLGRRGLLRVYIDRPAAEDGGVTLADCELVSGQIGAFLDVEDPLPGSYVLEVSSPGVDRKLRTAEHFLRFVGEEVKVELKRAEAGRRRLRGRIVAVEKQDILLDVEGGPRRLDVEDIATARLVPPKSA
jgi:ribosome maturation factor RimP